MMYSNPKLLSTIVLLLCSVLVTSLALPVTETAAVSTLHGCSVYVQRWCPQCGEIFDATYYNYTPPSPLYWPIVNIAGQTSLDQNSGLPGQELVPVQVGSFVMHIINVANPVTNNSVGGHSDPGKLSFSWGDQKWNSWGKDSPCLVIPVGENWKIGGATVYSCNWLCDA